MIYGHDCQWWFCQAALKRDQQTRVQNRLQNFAEWSLLQNRCIIAIVDCNHSMLCKKLEYWIVFVTLSSCQTLDSVVSVSNTNGVQHIQSLEMRPQYGFRECGLSVDDCWQVCDPKCHDYVDPGSWASWVIDQSLNVEPVLVVGNFQQLEEGAFHSTPLSITETL